MNNPKNQQAEKCNCDHCSTCLSCAFGNHKPSEEKDYKRIKKLVDKATKKAQEYNEAEDWEREFDKLFLYEIEKTPMRTSGQQIKGDAKEVKSFIRNLLTQERDKTIEKLEKEK